MHLCLIGNKGLAQVKSTRGDFVFYQHTSLWSFGLYFYLEFLARFTMVNKLRSLLRV